METKSKRRRRSLLSFLFSSLELLIKHSTRQLLAWARIPALVFLRPLHSIPFHRPASRSLLLRTCACALSVPFLDHLNGDAVPPAGTLPTIPIPSPPEEARAEGMRFLLVSLLGSETLDKFVCPWEQSQAEPLSVSVSPSLFSQRHWNGDFLGFSIPMCSWSDEKEKKREAVCRQCPLVRARTHAGHSLPSLLATCCKRIVMGNLYTCMDGCTYQPVSCEYLGTFTTFSASLNTTTSNSSICHFQ